MTPDPIDQATAVDAALDERERALYRRLLRRFADGGTPTPAELAAAAAELEVDLGRAAAVFAAEDLVHFDSAGGAVRVAYPFSATPRGHRVQIDGEHWVEAMCAIDALGIAAMLDRPIEVISHDPVSGGEVWVRVDPGDGAWWEPESAVVLAGSCASEGPSFRSCCDVLNFFESGEHALQYLLAHPEVSGHAITSPDAIAAGAAIFGDLLEED